MIAPRAMASLLPDRWLLLAAMVLAPLGVMMVRAITYDEVGGGWGDDAVRQVLYIAGGLAAMLTLARIDYRLLGRLALPVYLGSVALLIAVLMTGADQYGARRWIDLGAITVQPSEFAKIAVVIAVATIASRYEPALRAMLATLMVSALPMGLIVIEPDLGTTIVIAGAWLAVVAMWGVPFRMLGAIVLLGVSLLPVAFAVAVPEYQWERLAVFLDPGRDPLGSGFQLRQVEIALGAGHLTGVGFDGAPSALDGLATRASDFAFAQLGEHLGFLGALLILALFFVVAWRGFQVASEAPDRFGRLLAAGLTTVIVFQAALHVGVNLRLFPATGIPLPFVSQGGSALLVTFAAVGILQSIAAHRVQRHRGGDGFTRW